MCSSWQQLRGLQTSEMQCATFHTALIGRPVAAIAAQITTVKNRELTVKK